MTDDRINELEACFRMPNKFSAREWQNKAAELLAEVKRMRSESTRVLLVDRYNVVYPTGSTGDSLQ